MGPEATADLFQKVIRHTAAAADQDHLRVIIDNNPQIPDRTAAILGTGISPREEMIATARNLEQAGAGLIIIPCNTAHHWIQDVRDAVKITVIDMLYETACHIATNHPSARHIGLLASTGTITAGLYQQRLKQFNVDTLVPSTTEQELVMKIIYSVKSGHLDFKQDAIRVSSILIQRGAQLIVAGCTEIPLILTSGELPVPLVDPTSVLAQKAILAAGGKLRPQQR